MSLEIKDVIYAAKAHFEELLPDLAEKQDLRLEEIEREGPNWTVTFSVPSPVKPSVGSEFLGGRGPFGYNRIAKVVVVDGSNGQFVALRQRAA